MSFNHSRIISRLSWSFLAVFGSLALLASPRLTLADNAPAPAASAPAASTPAPAPAKPMAPAKKAAPKKKVVKKKHMHMGPSFTGTITAMDLSASPMTVVAVRSLGKKKGDFVFGGILTSHTIIMKGKKHIKPSALKKGQKAVIYYKRAMGTLVITKIWVR